MRFWTGGLPSAQGAADVFQHHQPTDRPGDRPPREDRRAAQERRRPGLINIHVLDLILLGAAVITGTLLVSYWLNVFEHVCVLGTKFKHEWCG